MTHCRVFHDKDNIYINLNARNSYEETGFHLACKHGHSKVVEVLMKNSDHLNLHARNKDGRTGFHLACMLGRIKVVDVIMKNSADLNICSYILLNDRSSIQGLPKVVEVWMKNSANLNFDLNAKDSD